MDDSNDFIQLRNAVSALVKQYLALREKIDWKDSSKSATIMRLAKPFQTGYFTIAVAGKMSAGKSTFINSLIGEDLLPTGHFQTTSGITWIVSSDKRLMEVTYADGKKKEFTHDFANVLKTLIAVPEEFDSLPINHIDRLIKGGDDVASILKKKAAIEQETGTSATDELWEKYVSVMPKSKIAEKVVIHLQLPKEYEGWRIVDTPGVGAIGGIQDATKRLLTSKEGEDETNVVDAVVLLHKGTENIQDESANKFAEDVAKSMGTLANGRLFFVLTHAGSPEFIVNKDGIISRAVNLFGKRLNIPTNRIDYVDSLMQHVITDAIKSGRDFSNMNSIMQPLSGWTQSDWNSVSAQIFPIYQKLMASGKECSNATIFSELEKLSRFSQFREMLYQFLNAEKEQAFVQILTLIEAELELYADTLKADIDAVSNGLSAIQTRINETKVEKNELQKALLKLQQETSPAAIKKQFAFVDDEIQQISKKQSISEIRTTYLQIIEKGICAEKDLFQTLKKYFALYAEGFNNQTLTFRSIDFDELERKALVNATSQVKDYSRSKKELVKKGGMSSDDEYKVVYPYTKEKVDIEKKRREFASLVMREGRAHEEAYVAGTIAKYKNFFEITAEAIMEKTNDTIKRLNQYLSVGAENTVLLQKLREQMEAIEQVQKHLKTYED